MPWGGNERLWEAMKGTDANAARQQNRFKLLHWRPALTSAAGARYSSGFYKRNTNPQKTGLGEPRGSVHPFPRGLSPWAAPDGGVLDLRTSGWCLMRWSYSWWSEDCQVVGGLVVVVGFL